MIRVIISFISIITIYFILTVVGLGLILAFWETLGGPSHVRRFVETMVLVFCVFFSPGFFTALFSPIYLIKLIRDKKRLKLFEPISFLAAMYTLFFYQIYQGV